MGASVLAIDPVREVVVLDPRSLGRGVVRRPVR